MSSPGRTASNSGFNAHVAGRIGRARTRTASGPRSRPLSPARGLVCQAEPGPASPAPSLERTAGLTILSTRDSSATLAPRPDPGLGAVDRRTGEPVETGVDVPRGCLRIGLPPRRWSVAEEPDRLERIRVALTNDTPRERIVRLLFDDPTGTPGITGLTPMLRDAMDSPAASRCRPRRTGTASPSAECSTKAPGSTPSRSCASRPTAGSTRNSPSPGPAGAVSPPPPMPSSASWAGAGTNSGTRPPSEAGASPL